MAIGRAAQFDNRLTRYGDSVVAKYFADTSEENKCPCWADGYPNPDCPNCDGNGYQEDGEEVTIKAFVQPREQSVKTLDAEMGILPAGDARIFVSGSIALDEVEKVQWQSDWYKLDRRDKQVIKDEVIYRVASLQRLGSA